LATQIVVGDEHYNFELSAWHKNGGKWNFEMRSVKISEEHTERCLYFPFSALPELRKQMVKMLEEHDGSQRIKESPKIPEWITRGFSNSKFTYEYLFHSHGNGFFCRKRENKPKLISRD
jgi:hypothetical protein